MKEFKLFVPVLSLFVLASCNSDDGIGTPVADDPTAGYAELSFTNGSNAIASADLRVAAAEVGSDFDTNNLFEGQTNDEGSAVVGPFHPGHYMLRLDAGTSGFLYEAFQVLDTDTLRFNYDIPNYASTVFIEFDPVPDFYTTSMYLVPGELTSINIPTNVQMQNANPASISNGTITFHNAIFDTYQLGVFSNDEFFPSRSITVFRDHDTQLTASLDAHLLLVGSSWTTQSTILLDGNIPTVDWIGSLSFEAEHLTVNFTDNTSTTLEYIAGISADGSVDVFVLENDDIKIPEIDEFVANFEIDDQGEMRIEYFDASLVTYQVSLRYD